MIQDHIISWLLEGDPSIQFQSNRDLLNLNQKSLQNKIAKNKKH